MTKSEDIFARNVPGTAQILRHKRVGIAGCGGLGSNAAVALVRGGVGCLILADCDEVELSNLNRQHFFSKDVGRPKVEALADHLHAINPDADLVLHRLELTPDNVGQIFGTADVLVEAFDKAENKQWLIESWSKLFSTKPLVCGNGLSGYGRTDELKVMQTGNLYFCGDAKTEMSIGLCSARVAIVAGMQANVAIELLLEGNSQ